MRIGIILTGDYGWAGGLYYSFNIIKLLHDIALTKKLKVLVIVNSSTPAELIESLPKKNIEITHLDNKPFFYKLYHKISGNRFAADINALKLDFLYPLISYKPQYTQLNCKVIYWMYDFQHKFLPELFSKEEINTRELSFRNIAANANEIVFSSFDSKAHFEQFYPESKALKKVYNFVSLLDKKDNKSIAAAASEPYFIVCNQFWPHKNHKTVLAAIQLLRKENELVRVIFTGKFNDPRSKLYVDDLKNYIATHHLEQQVTFTGFISREEQVQLMTNAKAIIQPSFFEGWSTVVEDAKALNKFLLAGDIPVNREQIKQNIEFFKPEDASELAALMLGVNRNKFKVVHTDYNENIEASKKDLIHLFKI